MQAKIAVQQYSLKDYEGGWDAGFAAVKRLGVELIEPWSGAVPNDPDASTSVDGLRAALDKHNLRLTCGHIALGDYEERYEIWKQFLLDYGSDTWVIPFARAGTLDEWLALLPKFREMEGRLNGDGLALCYHNHHMELEEFSGKRVFEHLLDQMPSLQAQFHIGQFLPERGVDLSSWIRRYKDRVRSLHVNDATADGWARLGEGDCRAQEAIKAGLDTGVDTFILERPVIKDNFSELAYDFDILAKELG